MTMRSVCVCVRTFTCDKARVMAAACDYVSLISHSKRESAGLPGIITLAKRGNGWR